MELKENERFVRCGSCLKVIRITIKGSGDCYFERCPECIKKYGE